ncbi:hypothetical protein Holit_01245 [Hollandina sp. SP2]
MPWKPSAWFQGTIKQALLRSLLPNPAYLVLAGLGIGLSRALILGYVESADYHESAKHREYKFMVMHGPFL